MGLRKTPAALAALGAAAALAIAGCSSGGSTTAGSTYVLISYPGAAHGAAGGLLHRAGHLVDILPRLKAGDSSYYADWSNS